MAPRGPVGRQDPLVHPALDGRDPDPQGLGDPGRAHIRVPGVRSLLGHLSTHEDACALGMLPAGKRHRSASNLPVITLPFWTISAEKKMKYLLKIGLYVP